MPYTVRDLIWLLDLYFPAEYPARFALAVLSTLAALYPLFRLHESQRRAARQPQLTAWRKAIPHALLWLVVRLSDLYDQEDLGARPPRLDQLQSDAEAVFEFMGVTNETFGDLAIVTPIILCTSRLTCVVCVDNARDISYLRKHEEMKPVTLLSRDNRRTPALLFVAHCIACNANYYPDRVTIFSNGQRRVRLERDPDFIRISKSGIWASQHIARHQAAAFYHIHSGWTNYTNFLNESYGPKYVTLRQVRRLFVENFAQRLLIAHGLIDTFTCQNNPTTDDIMRAVVDVCGRNGGVTPGAFDHACQDCTHKLRATSDIPVERRGRQHTVVGAEDLTRDLNLPQLPPNENLPAAAAADEGGNGEDEDDRYVSAAVLDGKVITHRKCALDECRLPLKNYRNGRFCAVHDEEADKCGIVGCGRPVAHDERMVCDLRAHRDWYQAYSNRFSRLSFAGVRRVIRDQEQRRVPGPPGQGPPDGEPFHPQLPELNGMPGSQVLHTFRAKTTYCVQTVQWSCGYPIAWGKCYRSEDMPQVLQFLNDTWRGHDERRPSFIFYDNSCNLLKHILTCGQIFWLTTTRFIIDVFHYITHRSSDRLCREWCNPAPGDGSQPNLVIAATDNNDQTHLTRAFNTETAEQFNSWLDKYKALLEQMSDVSYDFVMHCLFLMYKETVEATIEKKGRWMPGEE